MNPHIEDHHGSIGRMPLTPTIHEWRLLVRQELKPKYLGPLIKDTIKILFTLVMCIFEIGIAIIIRQRNFSPAKVLGLNLEVGFGWLFRVGNGRRSRGVRFPSHRRFP